MKIGTAPSYHDAVQVIHLMLYDLRDPAGIPLAPDSPAAVEELHLDIPVSGRAADAVQRKTAFLRFVGPSLRVITGLYITRPTIPMFTMMTRLRSTVRFT